MSISTQQEFWNYIFVRKRSNSEDFTSWDHFDHPSRDNDGQTIGWGTIHKRRQHFFWIFDNPLPHVGTFSLLSVGNFGKILTSPLLKSTDVLNGWFLKQFGEIQDLQFGNWLFTLTILGHFSEHLFVNSHFQRIHFINVCFQFQ